MSQLRIFNIHLGSVRVIGVEDLEFLSAPVKIKKDDGLPDCICSDCELNLKLFAQFKDVCERSDKILKDRLFSGIKIKVEELEVTLENGDWTNESSSLNFYNDDDKPLNFIQSWQRNESNLNFSLDDRKPNICDLSRVKVEHADDNDSFLKEDTTCSNTTDNSSNLNAPNETSFQCDTCLEEFNRKSHLIIHLKHHSAKYECDHCGEVFDRKYILQHHIISHVGETIHNDGTTSSQTTNSERGLYECAICFKTFVRKFSLIRHVFFHSKEKPLKCEICKKTFALKYHLERHVKTHNVQKSHTCNACGLAFVSNWSLEQHVKLHTRKETHRCEVCTKAFISAHRLNVHTKTHTSDRKHKCGMCDKTFYRKWDLNSHMISHTGIRPHKCEFCASTFCRKYDLIKHVRKVHAAADK